MMHLQIVSQIEHLKLANVDRIIISTLNINSFPKKFDESSQIVLTHVDILVITKTKLLVNGFSVPHGLDQNRNGGGIMIYVCNDMPSRLVVKHVLLGNIEGLFIELNFRNLGGYLYKC